MLLPLTNKYHLISSVFVEETQEDDFGFAPRSDWKPPLLPPPPPPLPLVQLVLSPGSFINLNRPRAIKLQQP